jgi:putative transcriptional regulator
VTDHQITSSLLVAMPQLQDPNFRRAVVLIVEHNDEGTFGLVLNRPVELAAGELCDSLDIEWGGDPELPLHWGGPVQASTGWVLFSDDVMLDLEGDEITRLAAGLSFAGSLRVLETIARTPPEDVRLFLGYAGWGPGQLQGEMAQGAWLVAPGNADVVFGADPDAMWDAVVRGLGVDPATLIPTSGVH